MKKCQFKSIYLKVDYMVKTLKPKVIISKCIEFDKCRYNGSIISSSFVQQLKDYVEFVPVCPEVAIGMTIPREAVRLVSQDNQIKLLSSVNGVDYTDQMDFFCKEFLGKINEVSGFILKSRSPSCGIKEVKLYNRIGKHPAISKKSKGKFGEAVLSKFGFLAVEDEGRLTNFQIREHFLTKLFIINRFKCLPHKINDLVKFHSHNKYLFMAYNQSQLKVAGKIVANHNNLSIEEVFSMYQNTLYQILAKKPRIGTNTNVLLHIFGYFSKNLSSDEKSNFLEQLDLYRNKQIPLAVLTALLKSWSIRFKMDYLLDQTYFSPFPLSLMDFSSTGKGREI
jgi:uncharacterized protein YbgA (DUF1722 family)/uncharacterized protein YbbK (DUF523 family)